MYNKEIEEVIKNILPNNYQNFLDNYVDGVSESDAVKHAFITSIIEKSKKLYNINI